MNLWGGLRWACPARRLACTISFNLHSSLVKGGPLVQLCRGGQWVTGRVTQLQCHRAETLIQAFLMPEPQNSYNISEIKGRLLLGTVECICVLQWVRRGKGSESRAPGTSAHLECHHTGCPEAAGSFEVAPAGTGRGVDDGAAWHAASPGGVAAPRSLFYGSCESRKDYGSCESRKEKASSGLLGWL